MTVCATSSSAFSIRLKTFGGNTTHHFSPRVTTFLQATGLPRQSRSAPEDRARGARYAVLSCREKYGGKPRRSVVVKAQPTLPQGGAS